MKYRKKKIRSVKFSNSNKKKKVIYIMLAILSIAAIYLGKKLFIQKEKLIEEPIIKEIIIKEKEETFMKDLNIIQKKENLSDLDLKLKVNESYKIENGSLQEIDMENKEIFNKIATDNNEETPDNLTGGYKIRDDEKQMLIKRSEKGLNEWKDNESIYEILKEQNEKLLEDKAEERLGE